MWVAQASVLCDTRRQALTQKVLDRAIEEQQPSSRQESRDSVVNIMLPAISSSLIGLYMIGLVKVWRGISLEDMNHKEFHMFDTLIAVRYQNELISLIVRSYAGAVGLPSLGEA